ncbi:uncharacterized protein LOC122400573 [Colletes gigas]|uniref:uncharacterized protein LOC122400573 n=1 Tax=Colletes gigas TaxID=935657 RepID=UPI001C9AEDD0|nr:uncharacterized protein LOC122400573 [Colletes gigas]
MSSSSTSQTRKSEIANKQKHPGCSTPLKSVDPRLSSISLSAIETNSSSDGARKRKLPTTEASLEKKQKRRRKDLKKKSKRNVRKRAVIASTNSDSDWVTELETSDVKQQTTGDTNSDDILFKDLRSPELIRREHHVDEDYLESPITRPRRNEIVSPEKLEGYVNYEPLSPNDTSHLLLRIQDTDDEEEAQLWKSKDVLKIYARTKIHKKKAISPKDKSKQWLVDVAIPSTTSNLLWDDYVQKHPEEMRPYVKDVNEESCKKNDKDDNRNKRPTSRLWPESEIPPNMSVVRGTWNHSLKKFDLVYDDVYKFPESTDEEFANDKVIDARISLSEFRRQRRVEKKREQATSSRRVRPRIISSIKLTNLRYERQGQDWKII